MKAIKSLFFIGGFLCSFAVVAQEVSGRVQSDNGEQLAGANLYWMNTTLGAVANQSGHFTIQTTSESNQLIASFVGYRSDTIAWSGQQNITFKLVEETLETVELSTKRQGMTISNVEAIKTESISKVEIGRAHV